MKNYFLLIVALLVIAYAEAQKKPLDHSVYNSWQSIGEKMISNDGKWIVYTIDVQEGDNELIVQSADAAYKKTIPRGYNAVITEDSRFVIFKIKPFFAATRDAKIKKKKMDEMPKDSMGIIEFGKEEVWKKDWVKSYKTPQKAAGWVAYQLEKPFIKKDKTRDSANYKKANDSLLNIVDSLKRIITESQTGKKKKNRDENEMINDFADDDPAAVKQDVGTDLVLKKFLTGEERIYKNVVDYYFSKNGTKLLVEAGLDPKDSASKSFVILSDLQTSFTDTLSKGENEYSNFAMTDDGSKVAFTVAKNPMQMANGMKDLQQFYVLRYFQQGMDSAVVLADKNSAGMKLGMTISENGATSFSKSGKRLFFGVSAIQPPKDTTLIDIDLVKLDVWHYNDDYLQTTQLKRLPDDLKQNYLAVYDFENNTIKQLGDRELPDVIQTNEGDGDTFIGVTDFGKRIESQWQGSSRKDIYAIDVNDGTKKLVKKDLYGNVYPSSTGKYILWYDREAKNYFVWDGETSRNVTQKIKVPLYDEENDVPDEPQSYGIMGWGEKDSAVFVYDRYDIWRIDPSLMNLPINISQSIGRKEKTSFRLFILNPEKRFFVNNDDLYFRKFSDKSKKSGLAFISLDGKYYTDLIFRDSNFLIPPVITNKEIGRNNEIIYTKESFVKSPDLYFTLCSPDFGGLEDITRHPFVLAEENKLSSINAQQQNYLWGTAELFKWKAYNGKQATGLIYKPENFDPKNKYPMICYFYEKLSDNLYKYYPPSPIRSAINIPFYTSRGYIIFVPDIEYKIGHPGKSAYNYVVSGARALVKKGFVDSTNMAIQGHSWGGYQVAQLVTMTKLFKAAWAGAPVANMTSAYGGIRWESGLNRQMQYEKQQSRIGATLWDKPRLYIENSPLFHLKNVTTPLVIMHNDNDGAVPWYQGIELFTAMRRLGKKVWMLNYNGEGHGLTDRKDKLDYQVRMQQFFDWILKGEYPAKWITDGVPAVKKGKDWGLGN